MEGDGDGEGETPTAPGELVRYSSGAGGDLNASMRLLDATDAAPDPADLQSAHQMVRYAVNIRYPNLEDLFIISR